MKLLVVPPGALCYSTLWASCIALAGCAGGAAQKAQLAELRSEIRQIRSLQAEQTSSIGTLEKNVRRLNGRLEELEYGQEREIGQNVAGIQSELSNLRRRLPPPAIVPSIELDADEVLASKIGGEEGRLLSNALVKLRAAEFSESLDDLRKIANQANYDAPYLANILFWTGVAYDGLGDGAKALAAYHDLIGRFSKHQRVPLALLRQGSVFIRLKDKETARLTFKKLIAEFPKTTEAARAKERLKDL